MNTTPTDQHLALVDAAPDAEAGRVPLWEPAAAAVVHGFDRAVRFVRDYWLLAAVGLGVLAVLGGLVWLVWVIVAVVVSTLVAIAGGVGTGTGRLYDWFAGGPITHAISDPVRAFLDAHTAGLPATGRDLWITWLVTAGVLYLAALSGSIYPRIGWAGLGALTAAAAYFGAATETGPAAAGVTAAVWLLLSLPVYARLKRVSLLEQLALDLAQRRAARQDAIGRSGRTVDAVPGWRHVGSRITRATYIR